MPSLHIIITYKILFSLSHYLSQCDKYDIIQTFNYVQSHVISDSNFKHLIDRNDEIILKIKLIPYIELIMCVFGLCKFRNNIIKGVKCLINDH